MKRKILVGTILLLSLPLYACQSTAAKTDSSARELPADADSVIASDEVQSTEENTSDTESKEISEPEALPETSMSTITENVLKLRSQLETHYPGGWSVEYSKDSNGFWVSSGILSEDSDPTGVFHTVLVDLDEDGEEELLALRLGKGEEYYEIYGDMYDHLSTDPLLTDSAKLIESVFPSYIDTGYIRFFVNDGNTLCFDSQQHSWMAADGVRCQMSFYQYDGSQFQEITRINTAGSDFYEAGQNYQTEIKQLRSINMNKTAADISEKDTFHINAAEASDLQGLCKIVMYNSYQEYGEEDDPYAWFDFVESNPMRDVFPNSQRSVLTADELQYQSKSYLRIARNELFARYGRVFSDNSLKWHFRDQPWYAEEVTEVPTTWLSEIELQNLNMITSAEQTAPSAYDYAAKNKAYTKLSQKELEKLSDYFNEIENNGFLTSSYQTIKDINLGELLYNGAGLDGIQITEENTALYLSYAGYDEVYTALEMLSRNEIDRYLMEHTGYSFDEMNSELDWIYIPELDAFATEHGDTNWSEVEFIDGYATEDDQYILYYSKDSYPYLYENSITELTVEIIDGEYRCISNIMH